MRIHPGLVLLYRTDGFARLASVDAQGSLEVGRTLAIGSDYKRAVAMGPGWLFFYHPNGYAGSMRLDDRGNPTGGAGYSESEVVNAGYDLLVHGGGRKIVLYTSESGKTLIATIAENANMQITGRPTLNTGWIAIGGTGGDYVVAVDRAGKATVLRVSETSLAAHAEAVLGDGRFTSTAPCARGALFFDPNTGAGRLVELTSTGQVSRVEPFTGPPGSFVMAVE
jgi:hypothetical protein